LRSLIKRHHLTLSDLKNEIGSKSTVSLILSGKRNLTRTHAEKLSARFKISPGVFFDPVQSLLFIGKSPRVPRRNLLDPLVEPEEQVEDALLTDVAIKANRRAATAQQNLLQGLRMSIQRIVTHER